MSDIPREVRVHLHHDIMVVKVFLAPPQVMQGLILPVTIPPRAHPRGFAIFFLLGGLFPTPGQAERDNSPPPGLLIDHKYVVLCSKLISVQ